VAVAGVVGAGYVL